MLSWQWSVNCSRKCYVFWLVLHSSVILSQSHIRDISILWTDWPLVINGEGPEIVTWIKNFSHYSKIQIEFMTKISRWSFWPLFGILTQGQMERGWPYFTCQVLNWWLQSCVPTLKMCWLRRFSVLLVEHVNEAAAFLEFKVSLLLNPQSKQCSPSSTNSDDYRCVLWPSPSLTAYMEYMSLARLLLVKTVTGQRGVWPRAVILV